MHSVHKEKGDHTDILLLYRQYACITTCYSQRPFVFEPQIVSEIQCGFHLKHDSKANALLNLHLVC